MDIEPYYARSGVTLYLGDCLEIMPLLPDKSIDFILADLPFGVTASKWDAVIPFDVLWKEYKRLLKPGGVVALFGIQPFTSAIVNSNLPWFKYEIVWDKEFGTTFGSAKYMPMKSHENIIIFAKGSHTYNPQMEEVGRISKGGHGSGVHKGSCNFTSKYKRTERKATNRYPKTVIRYNSQRGECNNSRRVHPNQKPVHILSWLVRTYSNAGGTVLDNTCGSGSTLVAAMETGRQAIGIEMDQEFAEKAAERCCGQLPISIA